MGSYRLNVAQRNCICFQRQTLVDATLFVVRECVTGRRGSALIQLASLRSSGDLRQETCTVRGLLQWSIPTGWKASRITTKTTSTAWTSWAVVRTRGMMRYAHWNFVPSANWTWYEHIGYTPAVNRNLPSEYLNLSKLQCRLRYTIYRYKTTCDIKWNRKTYFNFMFESRKLKKATRQQVLTVRQKSRSGKPETVEID